MSRCQPNEKTQPVRRKTAAWSLLFGSPKNAGKPRRSRRGWIGVGRAGLDAQASNNLPPRHPSPRWARGMQSGSPGIYAWGGRPLMTSSSRSSQVVASQPHLREINSGFPVHTAWHDRGAIRQPFALSEGPYIDYLLSVRPFGAAEVALGSILRHKSCLFSLWIQP